MLKYRVKYNPCRNKYEDQCIFPSIEKNVCRREGRSVGVARGDINIVAVKPAESYHYIAIYIRRPRGNIFIQYLVRKLFHIFFKASRVLTLMHLFHFLKSITFGFISDFQLTMLISVYSYN